MSRQTFSVEQFAGRAGLPAAPSTEALPITQPVNPVGLTFTLLRKEIIAPSRRIQEQDVLTAITTGDGWAEISSNPLPGTSSTTSTGTWQGRVVSATAGGNYIDSNTRLVGTFVALECDIAAYSLPASGAQEVLLCLRRAGEEVWAGVNLATKQAAVYRVNGTTATPMSVVNSTASSSAAIVHVGLSVVQNYLTIRWEYADGTQGSAYAISELNVNATAKVDTWQASVLVRNTAAAACTVEIRNLKVGRPNVDILVNHKVVRYTTGEPYQVGNLQYFICSGNFLPCFNAVAGTNPITWANAVLAVYSLDVFTGRFARVATMEFERNGRLWSDAVGEILYDEAKSEWLVFSSSWGNLELNTFTWDVHIWGWRTTADLLSGHNRLRDGVEMPRPARRFQYDSNTALIGGVWYQVVAVGENEFGGGGQNYHSIMYRNTSADPLTGSWQTVWEDTTTPVNCEGPGLFRKNGRWVTYSVGTGNYGFRCHDVLTGEFLGVQPTPVAWVTSYGHWSEHQYNHEGKTYSKLLLMDGLRSFLFQINETATGYEWPRRLAS